MMEKVDYIEFYDLEDFSIGLRKDNIVHTYIKSGREVNNKTQQEILHYFLKLKKEDIKYPEILEGGEFVSISSDIVSHTTLGYKDHVLCVAFLTKNIADRIMAKYYTKKYKTSSEFVFFTDFEEAVKFCYQKMDEQGIKYTPLI
ncbi:MAG: hypothetical protein M9916_11795 [Crocinitomicaceae bacterium]|nr:hypothetical protein [Crocinitomicaceae bacterium]